jgi:tetratricopeptide (TPR) repeat protein
VNVAEPGSETIDACLVRAAPNPAQNPRNPAAVVAANVSTVAAIKATAAISDVSGSGCTIPLNRPAIQPAVRLSTYVRSSEALAFAHIVRSERALNIDLRLYLDMVLSAVRGAALSVFGPGVLVTIAGSVKKKTYVRKSDVDLLVHSAAPATLEQVQALEALLKAHPSANPAHVKLGKLAIHANLFGVDCDIVCADTVEYGARPPVDERVALDPVISSTACALKLWAEQAAKDSRKIPGHALETLALHCRGSEPNSATVGDGAMQLCVSVLQAVADGGGDGGVLCEATRLDKLTRSSLAARAQATLHVFAVSRALLPGGCFRTAAEVRVWLTRGCCHPWAAQNTIAGLVPGWLFCTSAQQRAVDPTFSIFAEGERTEDGTEDGVEGSQLDPGVESGFAIEDLVLDSRNSLRLMLATPLASYIQAGVAIDVLRASVMRASVPASSELSQLQDLKEKGSMVAARMLESRILWLMGEQALVQGDCVRAAGCFASSMRSSVSDGDPFSGGGQYGQSDTSPYITCAAEVLSRDPCHGDAMLLRAWALRRLGRLPDAEEVLNTLVAHHSPSDARGALWMRANLRGNNGDWRGLLEGSERCLQICPEEPMFHYWVAIARNRLPGTTSETNRATEAALAISSFRRFLAGASPEGRKVSQALFEIAMLQAQLAWYDKLAVLQARRGEASAAALFDDFFYADFLATVRAAQAAEANRLPMFEGESCDARDEALLIMRMHEARAADGFVPKERMEEVLTGLPADGMERADVLRTRGNEAFTTCDFSMADEFYSKALNLEPENAELLCNRAAARLRLRWFTAAADDARAALITRPGWAKAQYRVAQAHMGRRDGASATAAASAAATLLPDDVAIRRLLEEALTLKSAQSGAKSLPDVRSYPQLWVRVAYKDNMHVVCADGGAAFACIADALQQLTALPHSPGVTLILLPGVYTEQLHIEASRVQLLGWISTQSGRRGAEIRMSTDAQAVHRFRSSGGPKASGLTGYELITATGTEADLCVEGLQLVQPTGAPHTDTGSCVLCRQGAAVRVIDCQARTPDSPVFAVTDAGSCLSLKRVFVRRESSAAALANDNASLECDECTFSKLQKCAVEVRSGARAVLRSCHLLKCAQQAVVLYAGGARLELYDCVLRRCGKHPNKSAVLAECGSLIMRRCTLENHDAEAIVLQASEKSGELKTAAVALLDSCKFNHNRHGVAIYFGSGLLLDCTALDNVQSGVLISGVPPQARLTLRGCTLARNGAAASPTDLIVKGRTLFERSVQLDSKNAFSVPPVILSDAVADFSVRWSSAELQRACARRVS